MGSLIKKMKERNEIKEDDNIITVDIINNNNININEISNVNQDDLPENKSSIFKRFFVVKGEWSFAQVRITDHRSICCFGSENSIIIVSTNGKYYKAIFIILFSLIFCQNFFIFFQNCIRPFFKICP